MPLDDDEKAQAEAAFLRELEEDHARRLARLAERSSSAAAVVEDLAAEMGVPAAPAGPPDGAAGVAAPGAPEA